MFPGRFTVEIYKLLPHHVSLYLRCTYWIHFTRNPISFKNVLKQIHSVHFYKEI